MWIYLCTGKSPWGLGLQHCLPGGESSGREDVGDHPGERSLRDGQSSCMMLGLSCPWEHGCHTSHSCCNEFYQQLKLPSRALQQVMRAGRAQSSAASHATVLNREEKLRIQTRSVSPERDGSELLKRLTSILRVLYFLSCCEVFFYLPLPPVGVYKSVFEPMKYIRFGWRLEWFFSSQLRSLQSDWSEAVDSFSVDLYKSSKLSTYTVCSI